MHEKKNLSRQVKLNFNLIHLIKETNKKTFICRACTATWRKYQDFSVT